MMLSLEEINEYLSKIDGGFKPPKDDCFKDDPYYPKYVKEGVITKEPEDESFLQYTMFCMVPHCGRRFYNSSSIIAHYNSQHRYNCCHCKRSLPTARLLDMHISEKHDSYFAVLAETKPMYVCFLEECDKVFRTPDERRDHCHKVHEFPKGFPKEYPYPLGPGWKIRTDEIIPPFCPPEGRNILFGHGNSKAFNKATKAELDQKNALESSKTISDLRDTLPETDK